MLDVRDRLTGRLLYYPIWAVVSNLLNPSGLLHNTRLEQDGPVVYVETITWSKAVPCSRMDCLPLQYRPVPIYHPGAPIAFYWELNFWTVLTFGLCCLGMFLYSRSAYKTLTFGSASIFGWQVLLALLSPWTIGFQVTQMGLPFITNEMLLVSSLLSTAVCIISRRAFANSLNRYFPLERFRNKEKS